MLKVKSSISIYFINMLTEKNDHLKVKSYLLKEFAVLFNIFNCFLEILRISKFDKILLFDTLILIYTINVLI